jgi:hypothetical protein
MLTSSISFLWKFFVVLKPLAGSEFPWDQTPRNQTPMGLILTESDPAGADLPGNQIAPGYDTHRDLISLYVISIGIMFSEVWYPSVSDSPESDAPRDLIWAIISYRVPDSAERRSDSKISANLHFRKWIRSLDGADEWKNQEGENIVILSL